MDNNALLEILAGQGPNSGLTNNQLLQIIVEQGGGGGGAVTSVNGKTGAVELNAADVGAAAATYDAVVPDTHATLAEAISDGKKNIFLQPGAHTLDADITIPSESIGLAITGVFGQSLVVLGDYGIIAETGITLNGVYFAADAGYIRFNGNNTSVERCAFVKGEGVTGSVLRLNSEQNFINNNIFIKQGDDRTTAFIEVWKANSVFSNNVVILRDAGNTITKAALSLTGSPYSVRIVGNRFLTNQADPWSGDSIIIGMTHADTVVDSNFFENLSSGGTAIVTEDYDLVVSNNRSYSMAYLFKATNGSAQYRRTYKIVNNLVMNGLITDGNIHDSLIDGNYQSHTIPWTLVNSEAVIITNNEIRNSGLTLHTDTLNNIVTQNDVYYSSASYQNTIVDNGTTNILDNNVTGRTV